MSAQYDRDAVIAQALAAASYAPTMDSAILLGVPTPVGRDGSTHLGDMILQHINHNSYPEHTCFVCQTLFAPGERPMTAMRKCPLHGINAVYTDTTHAACSDLRLKIKAEALMQPVKTNNLPDMMQQQVSWQAAASTSPTQQKALIYVRSVWTHSYINTYTEASSIRAVITSMCPSDLRLVGGRTLARPEPLPANSWVVSVQQSDANSPQLWCGEAALPFEQFRLLFTFAITVDLHLRDGGHMVRAFEQIAADYRVVGPALNVDMHIPQLDCARPAVLDQLSAFWLQPGPSSRKVHLVGKLCLADEAVRDLHRKYVVQLPIGPNERRGSWRYCDMAGLLGQIETARKGFFQVFERVARNIAQEQASKQVVVDIGTMRAFPASRIDHFTHEPQCSRLTYLHNACTPAYACVWNQTEDELRHQNLTTQELTGWIVPPDVDQGIPVCYTLSLVGQLGRLLARDTAMPVVCTFEDLRDGYHGLLVGGGQSATPLIVPATLPEGGVRIQVVSGSA